MREITHTKESIYDLEVGDCIQLGQHSCAVEKVTRGGMGLVYMVSAEWGVLNSACGNRAALKVPIFARSDQAALTTFKRELTLWAGFTHLNILGLDEILVADGDKWVASMEWCNGSLRDIITQKAPLPVEEACRILLQVIEALHYAYERHGAIHLDVKPENILYRYAPYLVSDWGIASLKQTELNKALCDLCGPGDDSKTLSNIGTVAYMAPERFSKGYRPSIASDMFSLGLIFVELISGSLPFDMRKDIQSQLLSGEYLKRAAHVWQALPKDLQRLIVGCLLPEPPRWSDYKLMHNLFSTAAKSSQEDRRFDDVSVFVRSHGPPSFLRRVTNKASQNFQTLKDVGRDQEAEIVAYRMLDLCYECWKRNPGNPDFLTVLADTSIFDFGTGKLGMFGMGLGHPSVLQRAYDLIESVVSDLKTQEFLDCTLPYWSMGRIVHQMPVGPEPNAENKPELTTAALMRKNEHELKLYELAIAAPPSKNGKSIASRFHKALAHRFAGGAVLSLFQPPDAYQRHITKVKELAPEVDFRNPEASHIYRWQYPHECLTTKEDWFKPTSEIRGLDGKSLLIVDSERNEMPASLRVSDADPNGGDAGKCAVSICASRVGDIKWAKDSYPTAAAMEWKRFVTYAGLPLIRPNDRDSARGDFLIPLPTTLDCLA